MSIRGEAMRGFGQGAAAYERGRPGYPVEAIQWLLAELRLEPGRTVLDVGAGTGKLTRELVSRGASVVAVEPVPAMRAVLEQAVPAARALDGTAEALPVADESVDAIVVASAFHWFDGPAAVAEFHRILRPGGRLALLWNRRRREQPLHAAISAIIEPYRGDAPSAYRGEWRAPVVAGGLFGAVAEREVPFEQLVDADGLVDRVGSTSFIAALPDAEREQVLARVRALAADREPPLRLGYINEAYVYERR
jgi:SAM-dependent methyltransferase